MNNTIVRIQSLTIENIKNTNYGTLEMPGEIQEKLSYGSSEIVGIYGQNGSGKTALIDSLYYLQRLMAGQSIDKDFADYINYQQARAQITLRLTIRQSAKSREELNVYSYEVEYKLAMQRDQDNAIEIVEESLSMSNKDAHVQKEEQMYVKYTKEEDHILEPKEYLTEIIGQDARTQMELIVAKRVAQMGGLSYIFGEQSRKILCNQNGSKSENIGYAIQALFQYASMDLFVIRNSHSGAISADYLLPMAFRIREKERITKGDFMIALKKPTLVDERNMELLHKITKEINIVLQAIVPGVTLDICDLGPQVMRDGHMGRNIELLSQRGDVKIPIHLESEGIIKIISILSVLIFAYNNPSICLAVDELDAGVYEYLLGEILDIFAKSGKGQLIFTSHNLRALEMLEEASIIFSTANPNQRYVRISGVERQESLRDAYIRIITLGGQPECLYDPTDSFKIARAFRNAGREIAHAEQRK